MSLAAKFNRKKNVVISKEKVGNRPYNKFINTLEKALKNIDNDLADQKLPLAEVIAVSFSLFEKEILKKLSVCKVNNANNSNDNTGTLDDPRMGTIESYQLCTTCDKTNDECTGHLAMMDLQTEIIHPFYRSIVIQVLNCICHTCGKLLITDNIITEKGINFLKGSKRLKAIVEASQKIKECSNPNCALQPVFKDKKANETKIWHRDVSYSIKKDKKEEDLFLSVNAVKSKLDSISDKDAKTLGFTINHPRNFIIDYIPVIPLNDRPYNETGVKDRKDHPLTNAYKEILSKVLESSQYQNEDDKEYCYIDILKYYSFLIKNNSNECTVVQKDPIKSITDILTHKDGLLRGNLMGKRCDYTGRTVLGPNRDLRFGCLAVSHRMKNLTKPETITYYNIERIKKMAREGKIEFFCPKKGNLAGRKLKFDINKHMNVLSLGDKIDRKSENGDYFIFNRQPSLHLYSMLGYKAEFQEKLTIGVHLSSTEGLNADFDGDEGNLHLVQTTSAQTEVEFLMNPVYCMINNGNSAPIAALTYNSVVGAYLMTHKNQDMSIESYNEGVEHIRKLMGDSYVNYTLKNIDDRLHGIGKFSYYSLVSILFPPDFWYMNGGCHISEGVLRHGNISKVSKGAHNGIIQVLYKNYSNQTAANFISAANFLFNWFLSKEGFSISIKDIMITPEEKKEEFIEERDKYIDIMNKELINLEELPLDADIYKLEERMKVITNIVYNNSIKVGDYFVKNILDKETNSINIMSKEKSGAKGEKSKLLAVVASLGQIFVNYKLPEKILNNGKRWLTCFSIDDKTAESMGYCKKCFYEGIDPEAYFANAQDGRRGMINTAVSTSTTGYLERTLIKNQEDLLTYYDGSVRNQSNNIFQYSYGLGFNPVDMVLDQTDNRELYSFIDVKYLCGSMNSKNGFDDFNLNGKIENLFNDINRSYGDEMEKKEKETDMDLALDDYSHELEEDYIDFEV